MAPREGDNRARLRAVLTFAGLDDITDFIADVQPVEAAVHDTIPVDVDFFAGRRDQKSIITFGKEPSDARGILRFVGFDLAAKSANIVLKLPARGVEGVPDRDPDILMGMMFVRIALYDDFAPRHGEMNRDMEKSSLPLPVMTGFDDDLTSDNAIEKLFKLSHPFRDQLSDGI